MNFPKTLPEIRVQFPFLLNPALRKSVSKKFTRVSFMSWWEIFLIQFVFFSFPKDWYCPTVVPLKITISCFVTNLSKKSKDRAILLLLCCLWGRAVFSKLKTYYVGMGNWGLLEKIWHKSKWERPIRGKNSNSNREVSWFFWTKSNRFSI